MKKIFVTFLVLSFLLSTAIVAFAAAQPFVDVPANSWAYKAIAQLAKDGIIDGYGDGTFHGDKLISRYEMAVIVSKTMEKEDEANVQDKELIGKLVTEFAAELNDLGVRVTKVEAKQGNIKFTADARLRFVDQDNNYQKWGERFRLSGSGDINDNVSFYFRDMQINQSQQMGSYTNGSAVYNATTQATTYTASQENVITDVNFTYHTPALNLTGGRYTLVLGQTQYLAGSTGGFDGLQGNWKSGKGNLLFGYSDAGIQDSLTSTFTGADKLGFANVRNIYYSQYNFAPNQNFNADVMYLKSQSETTGSPTQDYANLINIVGGGLNWEFMPKLAIIGDYWTNSGSYAKSLANTSSNLKAYAIRLNYRPETTSNGWINPKLKPGDWGAYIEYAKFDPYTMDTNWTGPMLSAYSNQQYWDIYYGVILAKNVELELISQFGMKQVNDSVSTQNLGNYYRTQFNFAF